MTRARFSLSSLVIISQVLIGCGQESVDIVKRKDGALVYSRPSVDTALTNLIRGKFQRVNDCIVFITGKSVYTPILSSKVTFSSQGDLERQVVELGEEYAVTGLDYGRAVELKLNRNPSVQACGYPPAFVGSISDPKDFPPPAPPPPA